jgi:hypothetical protein
VIPDKENLRTPHIHHRNGGRALYNHGGVGQTIPHSGHRQTEKEAPLPGPHRLGSRMTENFGE